MYPLKANSTVSYSKLFHGEAPSPPRLFQTESSAAGDSDVSFKNQTNKKTRTCSFFYVSLSNDGMSEPEFSQGTIVLQP